MVCDRWRLIVFTMDTQKIDMGTFEFHTPEEGIEKLKKAVDLSVRLRGDLRRGSVDHNIEVMAYHLEKMGVPKGILDELVKDIQGIWRPVSDTPSIDGIYTVGFYNPRDNWYESTTAARKFANGQWVHPYYDHENDGTKLVQWYDEPGPICFDWK